jgi:hypothetical protein
LLPLKPELDLLRECRLPQPVPDLLIIYAGANARPYAYPERRHCDRPNATSSQFGAQLRAYATAGFVAGESNCVAELRITLFRPLSLAN